MTSCLDVLCLVSQVGAAPYTTIRDLEVEQRILVEETGPDCPQWTVHYCCLAVLHKIRGSASEGATSPILCPHRTMSTVPHSSSTWFVWTALVAVIVWPALLPDSSRGCLLLEEFTPSLPLRVAQVKGTPG